jgi:hypothetical protein
MRGALPPDHPNIVAGILGVFVPASFDRIDGVRRFARWVASHATVGSSIWATPSP